MAESNGKSLAEEGPEVGLARSSLSDKIYADLRLALMSGAYKPGERLNIRKLAVEHHTSPTPVRDAIIQLVREMALELPLGHHPRVPVLSVEQYIKIREVRAPLERLAAELAAVHATEEILSRLRVINEAYLNAGQRRNWKEAMSANQEFHFLIYRTSGNDVLVRTIENLWLLTGPFINNQFPVIARAQLDTFPHLLIIDALRRRVPNEAGDLIVQDLRQGSDFFLQHLSQDAKGRRAKRPAADQDN